MWGWADVGERPRSGPPARASVPVPLERIQPGEHRLALGADRDGLLYVPRELPAAAPLLVLLHGATGAARGITSRLDVFALADRVKAVVLAPDSRRGTWDVIRGEFGPDVAFLETACASTFARVAIDPRRLAIGGFSDGATYGLSLGLINGDLFTHVLAFSRRVARGPGEDGPSLDLRVTRNRGSENTCPSIRQTAASCPR